MNVINTSECCWCHHFTADRTLHTCILVQLPREKHQTQCHCEVCCIKQSGALEEL